MEFNAAKGFALVTIIVLIIKIVFSVFSSIHHGEELYSSPQQFYTEVMDFYFS